MPTSMPQFNQPVPGQGIPGALPGYPVQNSQINEGHTGGLVDRSAIIAAGTQNGLNFGNQYQQMQRAAQNYKQQQAADVPFAKSSALPPPQTQSKTGDGQQDFFSSIVNSPVGQAVAGAVHAVGHMFGAGGQPAPAPQAAPAAPAVQAPNQAAPQAVQPQMNGGAVTEPEFMKPQPTILAFQNGGAIPANSRIDAFGVVPASPTGIPGFENGGAIPDPALAGNAGAAGAQNMAAQDQQMAQTGTQFQQGQAAAGANADASVMPHQDDFDKKVEQIHQEFLDHTLDDTGVPNKSQGVPNASAVTAPPPASPAAQGAAPQDPQATATAQAVQAAAANPAAKAGVAEESPSSQDKPHSIPHEQWAQWDQNIDEAVQAGARAGRDPGQVRAALEANRNAWVQGHVLRNLSAANVSLLNGDQKGVEKALRNAYYYMPDGRDMDISKDAKGNLQYQDPINPYVNDKGEISMSEKDGFKPNMVPVDAAHIQMLGQAMLDPMAVNDTIMGTRTAAAKIQLEHAQSQAALMTGQGNLNKGTGILKEGQAKVGEVNSTNYRNFAQGEKDRALASYWKFHITQLQKTQKLDPTQLRGAQDAASEYDKIALGRETVVPLKVKDPKSGQMVDNLDPNAGKTTRDTAQVPAGFDKLTPEQHAYNKGVASDISVANGGKVSASTAAYLAAMLSIQSGKSHKGAKGSEPNVLIDKGQNTGHVWDSRQGKYIDFYLTPNSATALSDGHGVPDESELAASMQSAGSGGAGIPSQSPDRSQEPDMEPQSFPASE